MPDIIKAGRWDKQ